MPYLRTSVTKNPVFDDATRGLASQQAFGNRQNALSGVQNTLGFMGGGSPQGGFSTPQTAPQAAPATMAPAATPLPFDPMSMPRGVRGGGGVPRNAVRLGPGRLPGLFPQVGAAPAMPAAPTAPTTPMPTGPVTDQPYTAYGGYNQPTQGLPGLQSAPTPQMGNPMFSAAEMNALAMQANQAQQRGAEQGLTTLLGYEPKAQQMQLQREGLAAQEETALGDIYNQMANQRNLYDLMRQRHDLAGQARQNTWLAMLTNMLGGQ